MFRRWEFYKFLLFFTFAQCFWGSSDINDWRVGFEFEMPYIGIMNGGPEDEAFPKEVILGGANWVLMRDTLDSKAERSYLDSATAGIWNLEFKTKNDGVPLNDRGLQEKAINEIQSFLGHIKSQPNGEELAFGIYKFITKEFDLVKLCRGLNLQAGTVLGEGKKTINLVFKDSKKAESIRPQLTIQLPLSKVSAVFHHLYLLGGDHRISQFFHPGMARNAHAIRGDRFFSFTPADGLIILFDFYVERFFMKHDEREPGPKPAFPIMSRLQFRCMYAALDLTEKEKFKKYVTESYREFVPGLSSVLTTRDRFLKRFTMSVQKAQEELSRNVTAANLPQLPSVTAAKEALRLPAEEDTRFLARALSKKFGDLLSCEYALNEFEADKKTLKRHSVNVSLEQIFNSIVLPEFSSGVLDDANRGIRKTSDYFSVPFECLSADYSMGALSYPGGATVPIAVLELRSYSTILENLTVSNISEFFLTEASYFMTLMEIKDVERLKSAALENVERIFTLRGKTLESDDRTAIDQKMQIMYP